MSLTDYDKQWCNNTLAELIKWPLTQPFRVPVDPVRDGASNYLEIVTHPMDLGTVKKKLVEGKYKTVAEFIEDLHLICSNAILFNGENSIFGYIATDIRKWVDDRVEKKPKSQEDEWQRRLDSIVTRLRLHVANAPEQLLPNNREAK